MKALVSHALETALKLGASSAAAEVSDEKGRCVTVRNFDTESIEYKRPKLFYLRLHRQIQSVSLQRRSLAEINRKYNSSGG